MQTTRFALLTGVAAMLLAAYTGFAQAETPKSHVLTLRLPDGQVEQVRYTGDVPPTLIVAPAAMDTAFDAAAPAAMLDQMTAAMNQQADIMFHEISAMMAASAGGVGLLPAAPGPGVCTRSIQITYTGNGQAPHIVSQSSGDCGPGVNQATPAVLPDAPARTQAPRVIQARAALPYDGLVRPVSDVSR